MRKIDTKSTVMLNIKKILKQAAMSEQKAEEKHN